MASRSVAVIGYGRMGLIHASNVLNRPDMVLSYIVGSDEARAMEVSKKFPGATPTTDFTQVLSDPKVQGVIICSPTASHFEYITKSIEAGKSVFCEKPIALSANEIKQCYKLAEEKNVVLFCGYQRRFDPQIKQAKKLAKEVLGDLQLLRMTSRDHPAPPQEYLQAGSTGSFFDDFSTHDVDIARWFMGEEPETVYATASSFMGVDDTAIVVLKFPSGALCVIDNSRQTTYGYDVRAEFLGVNGMATVRNPLECQVVLSTQQGHATSKAPFSFPERFCEAYRNELAHWAAVLDGKETLAICGNDCIKACEITARAQESRASQLAVPETFRLAVAGKDDLPYPTVPKGKEIGAIIFGTGRMGRVRATALQNAGVRVLYGFDIIEASASSFAIQFNCNGYVLTDESMAEALHDVATSLVFVSTTSSSHCKLIVASLKAGKHVFCEKPLALTAADTKTCVDLAMEKNLGLYCGFHRRSDIHFKQLKKSIEGTKQLIRVTSREPSSNSGIEYLLASGGFLFDSVIHDIDMAVYLSEEYPFEVYCQANAFNPTLKKAGDVDAIVVVLRFPSGCIVSIDNHRNAVYGYDQRAEVHTDQGMYSVENLGFTATQVASSKGFVTDNPPDFLARYKDAYVNETEHFVALLRGEESIPRSPMRDYVVTARIAEAARESLATGKPVAFTA